MQAGLFINKAHGRLWTSNLFVEKAGDVWFSRQSPVCA